VASPKKEGALGLLPGFAIRGGGSGTFLVGVDLLFYAVLALGAVALADEMSQPLFGINVKM
jgi:hypothetical protein